MPEAIVWNLIRRVAGIFAYRWEEEDKLNQHFDVDASAAGCWRAEQNESSLNLSEAHKCETDRCAANAATCMEF